MISYKNIGLVDLRQATSEKLAEILSLTNIGTLVIQDFQVQAIGHIKQRNVGTLVVVPSDQQVDVLIQDGEFEVDDSFVNGLNGRRALLLINGTLKITEDVSQESFSSIYRIIINGRSEVPKHLKSAFATCSEVNGEVVYYDRGDILMDSPFILEAASLWSFSPESVVRTEELIAMEKLPIDEIRKTFKQFKVDTIVATQEMIRELAPLVNEFHKVEKHMVPEGFSYFSKLEISDANISALNTLGIYVSGKLTIRQLSPENVEKLEAIKGFICDKCNVAESLLTLVQMKLIKCNNIKVLSDNVKENYGYFTLDKAYLTSAVNAQITNYGKMNIAEEVTREVLEQSQIAIDNYGKISCSLEVHSAVLAKVKENYGMIKPKGTKDEEEASEGQENDNPVTSVINMGRVVL